jgi:hypothetical protein
MEYLDLDLKVVVLTTRITLLCLAVVAELLRLAQQVEQMSRSQSVAQVVMESNQTSQELIPFTPEVAELVRIPEMASASAEHLPVDQ